MYGLNCLNEDACVNVKCDTTANCGHLTIICLHNWKVGILKLILGQRVYRPPQTNFMFLHTDKTEKTHDKFTYPFLIHMDDIPDILNLNNTYFLRKISLKCKRFIF